MDKDTIVMIITLIIVIIITSTLIYTYTIYVIHDLFTNQHINEVDMTNIFKCELLNFYNVKHYLRFNMKRPLN
jgi:hypothetical protein